VSDTKRCGRCRKDINIKDYKKKPNGKPYALCNVCLAKKQSENELRGFAGKGREFKNPPAGQESLDLSMFLKLPKRAGMGWTVGQAEYLALGLKGAIETGVVPDYKKIAAKYGSGRAFSSCMGLIRELAQAAKDEKKLLKGKVFTIKEYFDAGRPYDVRNQTAFDPKRG
jgi:hypothetical protein